MNSSITEIENFNFMFDASPIIEEMMEFINDISYFIAYASIIADLKHLPESKKESLNKMLFEVIEVREMYQKSLETEKVEELEERSDDICSEMELYDEMMKKNESVLDECLIYLDDNPKIKLLFGINTILICKCCEC
jgi:uncharacterized membrane protein YgaE (UPF0421/DUF939 family)